MKHAWNLISKERVSEFSLSTHTSSFRKCIFSCWYCNKVMSWSDSRPPSWYLYNQRLPGKHHYYLLPHLIDSERVMCFDNKKMGLKSAIRNCGRKAPYFTGDSWQIHPLWRIRFFLKLKCVNLMRKPQSFQRTWWLKWRIKWLQNIRLGMKWIVLMNITCDNWKCSLTNVNF